MRGATVLSVLMVLAVGGCGAKDEANTKNTEDQAVMATQSDAEIPAWLSPTDPMETGR